MKALVDNDILFKGACYGLIGDLVSPICGDPGSAGVLGAARFVITKKIKRTALRGSVAKALSSLDVFLSQAVVVEPTENEHVMAADFELAAQRAAVPLDAGESQLCAVLISRLLPMLLTGDKRAIEAFETLLDIDPRLQSLCGKVTCIEQLAARLLAQTDATTLRSSICAEPQVDRTLAICFSCTSEGIRPESFREGLQSYITALRAAASRILAP